MELLEVLLAIAVWIAFGLLGRRKRAVRPAEVPEEVDWTENPPGTEPETPVEHPAAEMPRTLREFLGRLQEEFAPRAERPEASAPVLREPFVPEEVPEPPPPIPATPPARPAARRRSTLVTSLLEDLDGGDRSLARAVLLREVLGPPAALRSPTDLPGGAR